MSNIDGTWNTTINTPMGQQNPTLTLQTDGGSVTGKMSGPQGDLDLKDGSVDGDSVSFKADLTQPMPITLEFDLSVDGDNISGNVKLGSFGNATLTGTRA